MSQPYIGEIRVFAGTFNPLGWAFCDGQLLAITGNSALFSLIGTTYGGDGQVTFGLPDLRGRLAVHQGLGFIIGQSAGTEEVTLNATQMPAHTHPTGVGGSTAAAATASPLGALPATPPSGLPYADAGGAQMAAGTSGTLANVGGSQSHSNLMPFLCLNHIIALEGVYPTRA